MRVVQEVVVSLIIKYGESLTREVLAAVPEALLSSLAQSLPSSLSVSVVGSLLHLALKYHCQVPVIELLSGLHPNAAKVTDAKGQLLLALAIELKHPFSVIELLSGLHREAIKVTDAKGRLPLALAIEVKHPSMEVLELLVSLTSDLISAVRVELFIHSVN